MMTIVILALITSLVVSVMLPAAIKLIKQKLLASSYTIAHKTIYAPIAIVHELYVIVACTERH